MQSLSDPTNQNAIQTALASLQSTFLGPVATTIAIIAIVTVGLRMLAGFVDWRRGVTTIAGCFVLFGAPAIAAALQSLTNSSVSIPPPQQLIPPPIIVPASNPAPIAAYDPYAGASVPDTDMRPID